MRTTTRCCTVRPPACGERAAGPEPRAPRHPSEPAAPAGAFSYGSVAPRVVPFQVSLTEAQRAFERWQQAHWLAPGRVLRRGHTEMRALLLPFWLFEAAFQVEFTGAPRPGHRSCGAERAGPGGVSRRRLCCAERAGPGACVAAAGCAVRSGRGGSAC